MIRVRCVGHIATSLGKDEVEFSGEVSAVELVENLGKMVNDSGRIGFNVYNTLVMVNDGEAFIPAGKDRLIRDGDSLVLIPVSHGG